MKFRAYVTASLLAALTATTASAHANWISERAGGWAVVRGEGSASDEAYDPAKVTTAAGMTATGQPVVVEILPQDKNVMLKPADGAAVLTAIFVSGWWTKDANDDWHNEPADAYPGFKSSGLYQTYMTSYIAETEVQKPTGATLEIVPLSDPTEMAMGDKLEVQVLMNGAPVEGVTVTNDVLTDWDVSSPATDAEGKTVVIVANNGLNVAQVYHRVKTGERTIAGHQAVLSFVAHGADHDH